MNPLDYILVVGFFAGCAAFIVYNPMMYGCIEPHWSKKFLLGLVLMVVSVAGLIK